ncbi:thiosulfate oxidation carrier complex protein SoxZ [Magnetofaba australis]|uniref:Putative sulfur oxidation protein SoxZ n=1 Tax=Magnetofaba australis IT-1 TaxID=1434232 RepID=A0A1Y2K939_9PROT|nr:thiosulfate oxidation carrier complex protein SoxZ [Magnetofaba australis]OSM05196.1 putative sulfur oxidation protein SoxZ [Magnetofaba australis IT-1]
MASIGKAKVKVKKMGDVAEVKAVIKHPMETGLRKNKKTGEKIPAHYIETVEGKYNGKTVFQAEWGAAVSQNPFVSFYIKADAPGELVMTWKDNKGGVFTESAKVK